MPRLKPPPLYTRAEQLQKPFMIINSATARVPDVTLEVMAGTLDFVPVSLNEPTLIQRISALEQENKKLRDDVEILLTHAFKSV